MKLLRPHQTTTYVRLGSKLITNPKDIYHYEFKALNITKVISAQYSEQIVLIIDKLFLDCSSVAIIPFCTYILEAKVQAVEKTFPVVATRWHSNLRSVQSPGRKFSQLFVHHRVTDLNGVATQFAIFKVRLRVNGQVQHHRNLFAAMQTGKRMLHNMMILAYFVSGGYR
jgi:hypothetical protein